VNILSNPEILKRCMMLSFAAVITVLPPRALVSFVSLRRPLSPALLRYSTFSKSRINDDSPSFRRRCIWLSNTGRVSASILPPRDTTMVEPIRLCSNVIIVLDSFFVLY